MSLLPGVYKAIKKNGEVYYRSSITCQNRHISLGSYSSEDNAHKSYLEAKNILETVQLSIRDYDACVPVLSFEKWVILINFRDSGIYIKTPIYLKDSYFLYYISMNDILKFDVDDLFYYSNHKIMKRGGHLFVSDYGMQVNIFSRYGIKNYAVENRDYKFVNGDSQDLRYRNIEIINRYHGVRRITTNGRTSYLSVIHIIGNYKIGLYPTEIEAAIAYNKAVDLLEKKGFHKNYTKNYISELNAITYASLYNRIKIGKSIRLL
ncbi:hypothetical protein [Anaeromicropila populeti]|uniref:AP2 domain-containing protein n=1 Tax=Anaeromicropila populeti TaxID=37658 RepID=A0A1I6HRE3_9FIRM|nr:hypothetical protein [Anaeromicropila populeti]SFR56964.1 hypothetical protein SAMN05661086_00187 [Anaeromicropila populeti]